MLSAIRQFIADERGTVTVDWVVLTAAIVALNVIIIVNMLEDSMKSSAGWISNQAAAATSQ